MKLSKSTVEILVDMIENKLAMIQVGDRDDLREVLSLQNCLIELQDALHSQPAEAPHTQRGRRRKFVDMLEEAALPDSIQKLA